MADRSICVAVTAVAACLTFPIAVQAQADCATLADMKIEDTNLLSSAVVPATDDLPEYCRVLGYVRPAINFEVRLPITRGTRSSIWRVRGMVRQNRIRSSGVHQRAQSRVTTQLRYATMDAGHWGASIFDPTWIVPRDPIARFDYARRAVTETARVSKELIAAFYGHPPEKSYFAGCSIGGRQALMEALNYPEDFDGVISGCPWLHGVEATTMLGLERPGEYRH